MSAAPHAGPTDNRALLHTIGHRRVRAVATEDSPYAVALFEIVKQRSRSWTTEQWDEALKELDASTQTIEAFLNSEHARRVS
ncbi:MAG TPA: hypothetical protein VJA26_12755 [Gammaproteobacteria bacterium]|nr:hypothetical protein [Gammaproteobacteria bacterium]